jgi:hypothetical protein
MILDLLSLPTGRNLPQSTQDTIRTHHQALARWFRYVTSWVRTGEGAAEVSDGLPEPPILFGPDDSLTALTTWYGLLRQDIRNIVDEIGPQPQPIVAAQVGDTFHAAD